MTWRYYLTVLRFGVKTNKKKIIDINVISETERKLNGITEMKVIHSVLVPKRRRKQKEQY